MRKITFELIEKERVEERGTESVFYYHKVQVK
mgnify:CR=1 FL=1